MASPWIWDAARKSYYFWAAQEGVFVYDNGTRVSPSNSSTTNYATYQPTDYATNIGNSVTTSQYLSYAPTSQYSQYGKLNATSQRSDAVSEDEDEGYVDEDSESSESSEGKRKARNSRSGRSKANGSTHQRFARPGNKSVGSQAANAGIQPDYVQPRAKSAAFDPIPVPTSGVLIKEYEAPIYLGTQDGRNYTVTAHFDSGADVHFIRHDKVINLGLTMRPNHYGRIGILADKRTEMPIIGIVDLSWCLPSHGIWWNGEFNVVQNLGHDVVIDKRGTSVSHDHLREASEVSDNKAKSLGTVYIYWPNGQPKTPAEIAREEEAERVRNQQILDKWKGRR